jgi:putative (di)nucleoside polyphosphate hydrolase
MKKEDQREYRPNAGIVVVNDKGEVLVGERIHYPGVFQYPQGGIDKGEDPLDAALRELWEEIGLKITDSPIDEISEWLHYDFPEDVPEKLKKYRGQKQKWFFFRWNGDPSLLDLDTHEREFIRLKWADADEISENIVSFKKDIYKIISAKVRSIVSAREFRH